MSDIVRNYCMSYFAPDLSLNELYSDDASEVVEKVLVDTMISEPEVLRKEKKTVDDRVIQIEKVRVSCTFDFICCSFLTVLFAVF